MDFTKQVKLLTGVADWPIWKRKIRDLLDYHEGALDVIDGRLKKPEPLSSIAEDAEIKEHKVSSDFYRKANSYVKSMIASTITDDVYQKVMDKETAYEMWEALKHHFEATSKDQLFKICTEFFAFNWTLGDDVSTHIAKLRTLWSDLSNGLRDIGENKLPDLMLVCKVLQILPRKFETFKSSWMLLSKSENRTFDELTEQLCMFERNFAKTENGDYVIQEALAASRFEKKNKDKNSQFIKKSYKDDICNYCNRKGHWVRYCKKWISDGRPAKKSPSSYIKDTKKTADGAALSIFAETYISEADSRAFWIDNGATQHITNCADYFTEFTKFLSPCSIKAAGKERLEAVGKGSIRFKSFVGESCQEILLKDVWYVPEVNKNLFSVLAAQDRNQDSEFRSTSTECWLKINNQAVLYGTRRVSGSLFRAIIEPIMPKKILEVNVMEQDSLLQLYHERWGHQDKNHIKAKLERELGIKVRLENKLCEPCIYGKAHRLPFGNRQKATEPGELISADVCGPFPESFQKKRYLVVFKDSFTKFRYGYIIKEKSEVSSKLKHMLAHAKTMGYRIKEFLSDNGGEFDNREIKAILHEEGITQRLTAPFTPQQNGLSERENRTVVEMARTFKYSNPEFDVPDAMWAELVSSAIYILNRTGKSSVEGISPYELWMKKKPRLKHLRVIASTCYAHIPIQKRRKMGKKAVKGYLIGYDSDERYRIWQKEESRMILSRDVVFHENLKKCDIQVQLPIKGCTQENEDEFSNQGKYENKQLQESEDNDEEEDLSENEDSHEEFKSSHGMQLRKRDKIRKPARFDDYVMKSESFIYEVENPETYIEAINSKENSNWRRAMDSEITSLKENETWELVNLPEGSKAIPCKWVYRVKTNPDGSINKYKARLVIKGYSQRQGIDYSETFSPVAKLKTIRAVLSIAAEEKMHLSQFDVSTAFLYGELEETIYMQQPEGYENGTKQVCKLKRSLYGLKQAPRCWNKCFGQFLLELDFKVSDADPCLYIRERNGKKLIIALYVDDGLIATNDKQECDTFIDKLKARFKIVTGNASCFLGLEIEQEKEGVIAITQKGYAEKILKRFGFEECKPVATPMLKESRCENTGEIKKEKFPYREAVGALMYLMVGTRPDLAYCVGVLSRSLEEPSSEDIVKVKRVFRYIRRTTDFGITYRGTSLREVFQCYSDADFGGCTKTGKSTSGSVIIYAGGAVSWHSQRQSVVATSTTEAEIIAASEATKEILWLRRLYEGIVNFKEIPVLKVDNSAAVKLSYNPEYHRRTKHIEIKHFFVREKVSEGKLTVEQVSTENQVADIMTKPLAKPRLQMLCDQMGLSDRIENKYEINKGKC